MFKQRNPQIFKVTVGFIWWPVTLNWDRVRVRKGFGEIGET